MGLLAGDLDEALLAERAARRAQALAVVDRDLAPLAVGVARRVVALAGAAGLGLALGPGPEVEDLLGHRPLRHLDQRALVVGHALADAVEADVVGPALQHGVGRVDLVLERARFDGLDQPRDVALDQLVLQREGRRRDDHPAVVEQRGHEVAERLAGAGAGLDEEVLALAHRRRRPPRPSPPGPAAPRRRAPRRPPRAPRAPCVGVVLGHARTLRPGGDSGVGCTVLRGSAGWHRAHASTRNLGPPSAGLLRAGLLDRPPALLALDQRTRGGQPTRWIRDRNVLVTTDSDALGSRHDGCRPAGVRHQAVRRGHGGRRPRPGDPRRRVLLDARAVGLRQDHRAADDRRLRGADRGQGPPRRAGRDQAGAVRAQRQHRLPGLRAVPAPRRARQRGVRPGGQEGAAPRAPPAGRGGTGVRAPGRVRRPPARPALRRAAAARRACPCAGQPAQGAAARRAARARSTSSCAARCRSSSSSCSATSASPSSSSPTTRRRR